MNEIQIQNLEAAQAYIKDVISDLMEMNLVHQAAKLHCANHAIVDAKQNVPASVLYV